ncbi:MAG TPA: efflux RND transporter periplasmic adaptor subunit [Halothiobacillaceae bacterium]|nr:efflux RND transporter periplasmic adaptor subunit [Halothiobacillaceae bacterium]
MKITKFISRYRGVLLILGLAAVVALWVTTGENAVDLDDSIKSEPVVRVAVETRTAECIEQLVVAHGHLEPEQVVLVRAKTGGQIEQTMVEEGQLVAKGEPLAQIELDDRNAQLARALAAREHAQSDYDAVSRLADRGFQERLQVTRAQANLQAAQAEVESIRLDIEHTTITAPIDGMVNELMARTGDVVSIGDPVVELIENNPLRAEIQIPQHRVASIRPGLKARVELIDGSEHTGIVSYISSRANPETRTFSARVRVENPERNLPSGTSVTVTIPVATIKAHSISPALISQHPQTGALGVMLAEEQGDGETIARFVEIEPVRASADRVWVAGLPESVRLITRGQGFVRDGDVVRVVDEENVPSLPDRAQPDTGEAAL